MRLYLNMQTEKKYTGKPLCLDLDGTLIATDSLAESLLVMIKMNPLYFFLVPFWCLRGKYYLKEKIEHHSKISPEKLPYREELLEFVKQEKAKGRMIVLATASMQSIADKVAEHLGIFDLVLGSNSGENLRSANKRDELIRRFGEKGFDYAGDSKADLKVWLAADKAILVEPSKKILQLAEAGGNVAKVFKTDFPRLKTYLKQIRVYQWIKNILLFVPFLLAHKIPDFTMIESLICGFFAFSIVASFVYVMNDLLDLEADRMHPKKRFRALASGRISLFSGLLMLPILFLVSFGISIAFLTWQFIACLVVYFVLNIAYSLYFKKQIIVDIIVLSVMYSLRLVVGGLLADVPISPWLIEFSVFFFFSLAAVKRFSELFNLREAGHQSVKRRGYMVGDLGLIRNFGIISGYMSVLIIALYVNSAEVTRLYHTPELLWGISPLLLYWVSRVWFLAHRGKMNEDPIVFTGKDPVSYVVGILVVLIAVGATL